MLIAYSDIGGPPTTLQNQILAEGMIAADLFDAFSGTPTLAELEQYDIVVAFSNDAYNDALAMGNVLADYATQAALSWASASTGLGRRTAWMGAG